MRVVRLMIHKSDVQYVTDLAIAYARTKWVDHNVLSVCSGSKVMFGDVYTFRVYPEHVASLQLLARSLYHSKPKPQSSD